MTKREVKHVNISQFPAGSLFKIGMISNLFLWGIFAFVLGFSAFLGGGGVSWNEEQVTGVAGFITAFVVCGFFAVIGAVLLQLGGLLARFYFRKFGGGDLEYYEDSESEFLENNRQG